MTLLWLGIEPLTNADAEKLTFALQQLMSEDSSLSVKASAAGTIMLGAAGEDQLEAAVNQLAHRFVVRAAVTRIQIAYKETLSRVAEGESRYVEHASDGRQYVLVGLRVQPGEIGSGCVIENTAIGGRIPERVIALVEDGIGEVIDLGVLAGYPIDDVHVTVYEVSHHNVDSEAAFRIAGRLAFLDAALRAKPILLEPIMRISIAAPPRYESRVIEGLRGRASALPSFREEVTGNDTMTLSMLAPLSHMLGYAGDLSGHTERQGTFTMTFSHYSPVIDDGDCAAGKLVPIQPQSPPRTLRAAVSEPLD